VPLTLERRVRFLVERDLPGLAAHPTSDCTSDEQRKILIRLLYGFEGNLTSSNWAQLAKCSRDTALRDIDDLLARRILRKNHADGRSTSYALIPG